MDEKLLQIDNLHVHFKGKSGSFKRKVNTTKAVSGVSLTVERGKTLGIVGESGCGKSTLARTIVGLEKPTKGDILFDGKSIFQQSKKERHDLRRHIQMIFQDPFTSLNPRMRAGDIIAAPLKAYQTVSNISLQVKTLMELVGLKPDEHYTRLPHEFSGGQRQRIGIARAIALEPKLIICDEPVSALDVSIQAQVINLLEDLQKQLNLTYVFIAHDMSVVRHIADDVAVMYLGEIMEKADSESLYNKPQHPYTKALLSAVPLPDPIKEKSRERIVLTGEIPSATNPPSGCVFHTRCPFATAYCKTNTPKLYPNSDDGQDHSVACFYPIEYKQQEQREI